MEKENDLVVRCSSLHKIMGTGKGSSKLTETAKSYILEQAKESFYGIPKTISGKFLDKGIMNEDLAIEMINQVRFRSYQKNTERKTKGWLTGECDINGTDHIIDVKCSWSFDSFPVLESEAEKIPKKSGYDWQVRGYMYLYDINEAEVVWAMTSTPDKLLTKYDDLKIHKVDHIDAEYRLTGAKVSRCMDLEQKMIDKYNEANEFYHKCLTEIKNKNQWK